MMTARGVGWGLMALAVGLAANAVLGPLATGTIAYRYGSPMVGQGIAVDAVALFLVAPAAVLAAVLTLRGQVAGPVLGTGPAAFAVYMVPQYVIGPEYGRLPGNNERFLPFHLALFVLAAVLLVASLARREALPPDDRRSDRRRAWILFGVAAFVLIRWLPGLAALVSASTPDAAYTDNPTAYLVIALLDLGLVVPACVAVAFALRRGAAWARRSAYALIGWFATVPVSVAAMAVTAVVREDPQADRGGAIGLVAVALAFLVVAVLLYRPLLTRRTEERVPVAA
ncbi:hypothetical protein GCM10009742_11590 [Kribbella karoonensis]|uniref:Uncharacterized protein n=2 Tax=Kribbellaceae TaxID=2726069 RepID=A0ABP4P0A4_9ACTN